ncbi:hypothetical protein Tco_0908897 [Tanacetum coccineum]|uniref:Retrovirus-related Pol polyprotein from transposon TNT 1-94 n=1 Tax=Tanacetum coccineum TaxID=301880 RepID=A0ABQ5CR79_9ASTR
MGLWYPKDSGFELIAYSDANHVGCHDDCKSTSGCIQFMGEKLVSWSSKKQDCTAMSTAKVECVSLSACYAQVIWMRTQLLDYEYCFNKILMYCDSKSAIANSCNLIQHSRTKHINIHYYFIKERIEREFIKSQQRQLQTTDQLVPVNHTQETSIMLCLSHFCIYPSVLHATNVDYSEASSFKRDYAALIWEGLYYSLMHPSISISYPRFTKLTMDYILTTYPYIPKRTNELHHYVANDEVTEAYKVYTTDFQLVVPMTESQPTESSQGTNMTLSAPRSPNPQKQQQGESIAPKKPIIIRISKRKQPDPEIPIPTAAQIDLENLTEAKHLLDEDVNKLVEGEESDANKFADDMLLSQEDPGTTIDPGSYKESPEAKKVAEYVSVDEEVEEEKAEAVLIRRKRKGSLEIRDTPLATPTRSLRIES